MENSKFVLNHGCHRGTIASRDSGTEKFDTYEEAHTAYLEHKKFCNSIGYQIWFAEIVNPDGKKNILEQNDYH
jgi:hypothetical protein